MPLRKVFRNKNSKLPNSNSAPVSTCFGAPLGAQVDLQVLAEASVGGNSSRLAILADDDRSRRLVPAVIRLCAEYLRSHGLSCEGLFRISGSAKNVAALVARCGSLLPATTSTASSALEDEPVLFTFPADDPFDVACVAKVFTRELPEPLLTFELYPVFVATIGQKWETEAHVRAFKRAVRLLPVENFATLRFLCEFMADIAANREVNMMAPSNLAICWAPNLLRAKEESLATLVGDAGRCNAAVKLLFEHYKEIFSLDQEPASPVLASPSPAASETSSSQSPLEEVAPDDAKFKADMDQSYLRHLDEEDKKLKRERAKSVASPVLMAAFEAGLADKVALFKAGMLTSEAEATPAASAVQSSTTSSSAELANENAWEAQEYKRIWRMTLAVANKGENLAVLDFKDDESSASETVEEDTGEDDQDADFAAFEAEYKQRALDEAQAASDAEASLTALSGAASAAIPKADSAPAAPASTWTSGKVPLQPSSTWQRTGKALAQMTGAELSMLYLGK